MPPAICSPGTGPGHVLLFEPPTADRNELFVVRVDERGRRTPRPEPISAGQLDQLIQKQTGKELDAWSFDNNEATKAELSMERTSTRSVPSIAPKEPFSPQSEAELLSELNSQLPFEIQRKDFIAKEKSGTLVGWAVVGTGDQREIAKSKLAMNDAAWQDAATTCPSLISMWKHDGRHDKIGAVIRAMQWLGSRELRTLILTGQPNVLAANHWYLRTTLAICSGSGTPTATISMSS
ncbi:MAG: hypothetical protein R6U98_13240 [Pirellulaceae bacterium]